MAGILVVVLDDMRADLVRFMPRVSTDLFPHEFTQARANGAACTDTRFVLHTGTFIHSAGAPFHYGQAAANAESRDHVAAWLQDAGYTTGIWGKWIQAGPWTGPNPAAGWDTWRVFSSPGPGGATAPPYGARIHDGVEEFTPAGRTLDYIRDSLIEFITEHRGGNWYAHVAPGEPHTNTGTGELWPTPQRANRYGWLSWPVPIREDVTGKPPWVQQTPPVTYQDAVEIRRAARNMAKTLRDVDDMLVDVFNALDALGELDDLTAFFLSDQGVHLGEHRWGTAYGVPAAVQKQTAYEPTVKLPLRARGPAFPPGRSHTCCSQADVTATIVAIAGATPSHGLDGTDLRPLVADPDPERLCFTQGDALFSPSSSWHSIVTGPHHPDAPSMKIIRNLDDDNFIEMYDLAGDPDELVNLAGNPERADEQAMLTALLDATVAQYVA